MLEPELRREMLRDVKFAGIVPVPVAAMTAGSACWRSHSMVSPSDLCPSSRVSWKTLAAHRAGIRILRPLPSTLVCRSFVEVLFGGGFLEASKAAAAAEAVVVACKEEVLERLEVFGSAEMAREGYMGLEQEASSSFFSSNWNGKFGRW